MISRHYARFIQALLYLMLISAGLHLVLILLHSFITKGAVSLNFFAIIGLNLFYPDFVASHTGYVLSYVVSLCIFIGGYFYLAASKK